jgi:hypothetical protein
MRKWLISILAILLVLSLSLPGYAQSTDEHISKGGLRLVETRDKSLLVELQTPLFESEDALIEGTTYQMLTVPDYSTITEPGVPQLPVISTLIGVPPEAQVRINVLLDEYEILPGTYNIVPAPSPQPLQADLQPGEVEIKPDLSVYNLDSEYPSQLAIINGDAWLRDQRLVRLKIFPFQYNPVQGKITWHKTLHIEVNFDFQEGISVSDAQTNNNGGMQPFESVLRGTLLNYEQAAFWRGFPSAKQDSSGTNTNLESIEPELRYKITVDQDGLYNITYEDLKAVGLNVDQVDPGSFSITNQGEEVAVIVTSTGNTFSAGDSILFYGQKFRGTVMEEKYTEDNAYWLTVGSTPGLRMASVDGTPTNTFPVPEYYTTTVHAEESHNWWTYHFTSDDTWFWEQVTDTLTHTYGTTLTNIVTISGTVPLTATLRGEMVAKSHSYTENPDHHTILSLNGNLLQDQLWDGPTRYQFDLDVNPTWLKDGVNQLGLTVLHDAYEGQQSDTIFFDWYEIEYAREFQADGDQIDFVGQQDGTYQYQIEGFTSSAVEVFNITDPLKPTQIISTTLNAGSLAFEVQHPARTRYYVVGKEMIKTPNNISAYSSPDLKSSTSSYDYVIITHQDFMTTTQRLADYRTSQGMKTLVVDFNDLVNEFNDGIYNSIAVRHFLSYAFENWESPPAYLLLVGDGHWDLKYFLQDSPPVFMPPHLAWADPWQGEVDSTNLLATVVGDDVLPDVAIGRLPVNSIGELNVVIDKIIAYESSGLNNADWRKNILYVADNTPDKAGDFVAYAEGIIDDYFTSPVYNVDRLYLDDFVDPVPNLCGTPEPGVRSCPAMNTAIVDYLTVQGASFVNYIGHAAVQRWAGEQIFKNEDVALINNNDRLSIVLSLTCLDGYWIHPQQVNLVNELLRDEDDGVVATFSPTGLGVSTGHDALQRGFYQAVVETGVEDLGTASIAGKLALYKNYYHGLNNDDISVYDHYDNYYMYDLVNTFTVFGDPALKIQYPYPTLSLPLISYSFP